MKKTLIIAGALAAVLAGPAGVALAAPSISPPRYDWSFSGPFGGFDRDQVQRGFKVFREACAACHGLDKVAFRNFAQPGGPEFSIGQVEALAAEYMVMDGPDDSGAMFERPARLADRWPNPFENYAQAAAANAGKAPPDLSVMAKARTYYRGFPWFITDAFTLYNENGVDYIVALLKGYVDPPEGFDVPPGGHYNEYYPGNIIAMPNVLQDGQISYTPEGADGPTAPETVDQYAKDVTAFLMWTAEPHLEERKRIGFQVMMFLIVFAGLLYFTKKKIWGRLNEQNA
ncbi:MAG: cytochrome c1 [Salinarimonadaceae bacterium]|nr:MAG: cytochrome c1 [Salinarimonadaceae bacterium]